MGKAKPSEQTYYCFGRPEKCAGHDSRRLKASCGCGCDCLSLLVADGQGTLRAGRRTEFEPETIPAHVAGWRPDRHQFSRDGGRISCKISHQTRDCIRRTRVELESQRLGLCLRRWFAAEPA